MFESNEIRLLRRAKINKVFESKAYIGRLPIRIYLKVCDIRQVFNRLDILVTQCNEKGETLNGIESWISESVSGIVLETL